MVKRTLVVLSVLSLTLMVAGTSFGFIGGGCAPKCAPLYVPVDCPDMGVAKTIVKTWECKIEGPCPAPMPACGSSCKAEPRPGMLCSLFTAMAHPCEVLFGGFDGVYGCFPGFGSGGGDSGCGSPFGGRLPSFFGSGAQMLSGDTTVFGALW
jgi:hypothetical protein